MSGESSAHMYQSASVHRKIGFQSFPSPLAALYTYDWLAKTSANTVQHPKASSHFVQLLPRIVGHLSTCRRPPECLSIAVLVAS